MDQTEFQKILVIDDDKGIRDVIRMQLKKMAAVVYEAENNQQTELLMKNHRFDAVICDIKLETENGFDIARKIRQDYPETPIIMLTGYIEEDVHETARNLGCPDILIKPVRKEKLLDSLRNASRTCR